MVPISYIRPARVDELTVWLLDQKLGLSKAKAETLAAALVAKFDLIFESKSPV